MSFFTPAAHKYFLPAFVIADLLAWHSDTPVFDLIHDFQHEPAEDPVVETLIAKFRSKGLTEDEYHRVAKHFGEERFALFNQDERKAIVAYLHYKSSIEECNEDEIEKTLHQY